MNNFWQTLKKPIFVLAPMADVTDAAFRRMIAKYGKPDVMWTEFVSADGLALAPEEGRKKLLKDLEYSESERPIVAQFFTSTPANMRLAAQMALNLGFDGVDINMGCPDKSVEKQGAGAAMIKNSKRALEIIEAAKDGEGSLPVSVKTRIGFNTVEIDTWIPALLSANLAALTVHLRTRKEMSKVPAHWEYMKRIVELRDKLSPSTLIIGNGDVATLEDARKKVEETGCDGVMIGKGIFGNPWLFSDLPRPVSVSQRLAVLAEHAKLFEELLPHKSFAIMKKHFKVYVTGFDGAGELRTKLMEANNASEVESIINNYIMSV